MRSIRRHLSLWLSIGTTVLIFVCGYACHVFVSRTLRTHFDAALVDKARALAALVEPEMVGVEFPLAETVARMPEFSRAERPEYFELFAEGGRVLHRSPSLGTQDLDTRETPIARPEPYALALPDGRAGRAVAIRFEVREKQVVFEDPAAGAAALAQLGMRSGGVITLVLARDVLDLERVLATLSLALWIAGGLLLVGTVLLVRRVVSTGCRPLVAMAERIRTLDVESSTPLEAGPVVPAELRAFQERFQEFRERIAASFAREKRLTSNIAHELRTPIAELRSVTELALSWPGDAELQQRSVEESHAIALQMERLLRTCLRLARLQSGQAPLRDEELEVSTVMRDLARRGLEVGRERAVCLEDRIEPDCRLRTDPELFELMLGNLIDNAFQHAPAGTWVRVAALREDGAVRIAISNPANGLAAADLAHLAEPFWHKPTADPVGEHLGLGLAMVSAAARTLGARFDARLTEGCFEASLLLARPDTP